VAPIVRQPEDWSVTSLYPFRRLRVAIFSWLSARALQALEGAGDSDEGVIPDFSKVSVGRVHPEVGYGGHSASLSRIRLSTGAVTSADQRCRTGNERMPDASNREPRPLGHRPQESALPHSDPAPLARLFDEWMQGDAADQRETGLVTQKVPRRFDAEAQRKPIIRV
jgi:hypothetical protein